MLTLRWALDFQVEISSSHLARCVEFGKRGTCTTFKTLSLDEITKGVSEVNKEDQGLSRGTFQQEEDRKKRRNQPGTLRKGGQ